jgi:hypothetical protein
MTSRLAHGYWVALAAFVSATPAAAAPVQDLGACVASDDGFAARPDEGGAIDLGMDAVCRFYGIVSADAPWKQSFRRDHTVDQAGLADYMKRFLTIHSADFTELLAANNLVLGPVEWNQFVGRAIFAAAPTIRLVAIRRLGERRLADGQLAVMIEAFMEGDYSGVHNEGFFSTIPLDYRGKIRIHEMHEYTVRMADKNSIITSHVGEVSQAQPGDFTAWLAAHGGVR